MDTNININFKVTPSQKETILSRMSENGFDEISAYLKVTALKTQAFKIITADPYPGEASVELTFELTTLQKEKLDANLKESECKDLQEYCQYVALHGVVYAAVEVRSTGDLDAMLQRITDGRLRSNPKKLF